MHDPDNDEDVRIDKWLWAARFFKTRALAAEAVVGGKVEVNGGRPKPSRIIRIGDRLNIRRGVHQWVIIVKALGKNRGPASEARLLYEETQESLRERETVSARLKLERPPAFDLPGRPSKRDRRAIQRFTNRGW